MPKIAVLGSAASVQRAPFHNEAFHAWRQGKAAAISRAHDHIDGNFDIWGCSPGCWSVAPRATRWFEVHRWEVGVPWFSPEYVQFLRDFKGPVYTGGMVPEIPNHVVYPIDDIEAEFSSYFLTSSLALMIAKAIWEIEAYRTLRKLVKEGKTQGEVLGHPAFRRIDVFDMDELTKPDSEDIIGIWGVDMAAHEEYAYQRPGCQFFVLEAMRRGIGVFLPFESDLMRPLPVYGISEWDHNYIKLTQRAREINARLSEQSAQVEEGRKMLHGMQGELHALDAFVKTWTSPYGMQHGMIIRQAEGTGLGSGITHFDGRPVQRMTLGRDPVLDAMAKPDHPDTQTLKALQAALTPHMMPTETPEQALARVIADRDRALVEASRLSSEKAMCGSDLSGAGTPTPIGRKKRGSATPAKRRR